MRGVPSISGDSAADDDGGRDPLEDEAPLGRPFLVEGARLVRKELG